MLVFDSILDLSIEEAKNFSLWEVECKDGCGLAIVRPKLVRVLQLARNYSGVPYHITSWTRCKKHNLLIGGDPNSSHPEGWAVDIGRRDPETDYIILKGLLQVCFPRIKIRPDHFHVDLNPDKEWRILL